MEQTCGDQIWYIDDYRIHAVNYVQRLCDPSGSRAWVASLTGASDHATLGYYISLALDVIAVCIALTYVLVVRLIFATPHAAQHLLKRPLMLRL